MNPIEPEITFSIVSHRHGQLIDKLLADFEKLSLPPYEIILTLNIAEDESFLRNHPDVPIRVHRNSGPEGFGANHNAAGRISKGRYFAVVNPDVRMPHVDLGPLLHLAEREEVGVCGPAVYSSDGCLQDSARRFPTLSRFISRRFDSSLEYPLQEQSMQVEWIAGMFMLFRKEVFDRIAGFDERYFMYLEDADICRRLHQAGLSVVLDPSVKIVHDARRASHGNFRHALWHLRSAARFLTGH